MERASYLHLIMTAAAVSGACSPATASPAPPKTATPSQGALRYNETPNRYVNVDGTRLAYRTLGTDTGEPPLVFLQHFTGTMDDWDPEVVEGLARGRRVYVFDNAGVGASGGVTPESIEGMAHVAEAFVEALHLGTVDILGFSLGAAVAQQFLLDRPSVARKAALAGTVSKGTPGAPRVPGIVAEAFKRAAKEKTNPKVFLFFPETPAGRLAANQFIGRINKHTVDPDPPASEAVGRAQTMAIMAWSGAPLDARELAAIKQPVLIVNGSNDIMASTAASYELFQRIPRAQLILYPDSGHASLFQYHDAFVREVDSFLRSSR